MGVLTKMTFTYRIFIGERHLGQLFLTFTCGEMTIYLVTKRKKGKKYQYLMVSHREGGKTVTKRAGDIGGTSWNSRPVAELIGEHIARYLIFCWNEKGRPRIPISQGITVGDLEKVLYSPGNKLTQTAQDLILNPPD